MVLLLKVLETPPRTWRGRKQRKKTHEETRNTSTHVERTQCDSNPFESGWKHLHARGEDLAFTGRTNGKPETPPRTWRGPILLCRAPDLSGNTSTHVERTAFMLAAKMNGQETPPRTWRGLARSSGHSAWCRNTSTHVERTCFVVYMLARFEKHLHARGEDTRSGGKRTSTRETPPRTWRGPLTVLVSRIGFGNTSTHVERTIAKDNFSAPYRKHLHARGEDNAWYAYRRLRWRNTSTHVERTEITDDLSSK